MFISNSQQKTALKMWKLIDHFKGSQNQNETLRTLKNSNFNLAQHEIVTYYMEWK